MQNKNKRGEFKREEKNNKFNFFNSNNYNVIKF